MISNEIRGTAVLLCLYMNLHWFNHICLGKNNSIIETGYIIVIYCKCVNRKKKERIGRNADKLRWCIKLCSFTF